jgi:hypothetical protein
MTKDDIIRMAEEARLVIDGNNSGQDDLLYFAALVAAAEREACAKLVEPGKEHRRDARWGYIGGNEGVELLDKCAAAIRARGTT